MIASPLELERHVFEHIEIEALSEREKGAKIKWQAEFEHAERVDDARKVRLRLLLSFGPEAESKAGYRGKIQILGFFRLAPSAPPEKLFELLATEGAALLFGAVREVICNLTARGPWPMVRLGNTSFDQMPKKVRLETKKLQTPARGKATSKPS